MNRQNSHLAQYGDLTWGDVRPDDLPAGFSCPEHGVVADFRTVRGSLLPHCWHCDRVVVQVEATEEAF